MSSKSVANATSLSHADDHRAQDPALVPVTYYPVDTQQLHSQMRQRVADKPYAQYFHSAPLYVRREAVAAIPHPIANPNDILPLAQARKLLDPGDHAVENGWYAYPDGAGYVTSKTQFPGCTAEMIDWWFWWHSVEGERYALWYPYNHCNAQSTYATLTRSEFTTEAKKDAKTAREIPLLERDDLPHRQRWLGSTHTVTEFIGPKEMKLRIEFKEPSYFGLGSWEELKEAGYEAAVCGILWDKAIPLKVGDMIHLWRRNENGLELRSRYYLAHEVKLHVLGFEISLDRIGALLGTKKRQAGEKVAYEQFLHDQTEFTNLASILPGLFREFGQRDGQGVPS